VYGEWSPRGDHDDLPAAAWPVARRSVALPQGGCFENASAISTCETSLAQIPILKGWIDAAA
jgi:hypothetical protein